MATATVFIDDPLVRKRGDQFVILFWIKPDPDLAIEIEIDFGPRRLVCKDVSPAVCIVPLRQL